MSLKYWQGPEWSAWILEQAAEDTLAKTRMYNADADIWRLLRPEDIGGAPGIATPSSVAPPAAGIAEKQYYQNVILAAAVSNIIIQFTVPAGIGITFMGFWITTHLGQGSVYEIDVNRVKRQEAPIRGLKGKNYAFDDTGIIPVGTTGFYHVNAILLEQFVFVRQNDLVQIRLYVKHAFTGQVEITSGSEATIILAHSGKSPKTGEPNRRKPQRFSLARLSRGNSYSLQSKLLAIPLGHRSSEALPMLD